MRKAPLLPAQSTAAALCERLCLTRSCYGAATELSAHTVRYGAQMDRIVAELVTIGEVHHRVFMPGGGVTDVAAVAAAVAGG